MNNIKGARSLIFIIIFIAFIISLYPIYWKGVGIVSDLLFIAYPVIQILYIIFFHNIIFNKKKIPPIYMPATCVIPFFFTSVYFLARWANDSYGAVSDGVVKFSACGVIVGILFLIIINLKVKNIFVAALFVIIPAFFYGYGVSYTVNIDFDRSNSKKYRVEIVNKYVSQSGKGHGNYFVIGEVDGLWKSYDYSVKIDEYNRHNIKDNMCIYVYSGYVNVRWYFVSESCL